MNFFRKIFGNKEDTSFSPFDLSKLKVDMHSHLIPGIDDGAKTMDQSIAMLAKFESFGFQKVITTPHIMGDFYRNTPEIILSGKERVTEIARKLGLSIEIEAAAEYYFDESLINRLKNKEQLLTFSGNRVLFEFSMHQKPDRLKPLFFELLSQGYQPVLAHFERYNYYHGSVDKAFEFSEQGIEIQLNFNSLIGHYGPKVKDQARLLVESKKVDFVASDCHRMDHLMIMERNLSTKEFDSLNSLSLKNATL
ncbi:MAG: histidinol phosphatase [Crocinitomicaceae bacterium]|nr:histidinol phosphatase [Crocinitomicaceae bacterium]